MRRYLWKLVPKQARESLLGRFSVVDRGAIDKILADNIELPEDYARRNCLFIHVPKCAGSSVKKAIFPGRTHGHMPAWFYERHFPQFFEGAFKFCFVRNPLERAHSAYRYLRSNKSIERDFPAHQMVMRYESFDTFAQKWLCEETAHKQMHFAPQWLFLCDSLGQLRMDFIGRQESMAADFAHICSKLGVQASLDQVNVSPGEARQPEFATRTIERIMRVYERDYELLGY